MNDNTILLQYYTNIDFLLDRSIVFMLLFLYLVVGSITRNVLFGVVLTTKQILVASIFNGLYLTLLSDYLIKIFKNLYFPMVLLLGLVQKEFIEGLIKGKLLKRFINTTTNGEVGEDKYEKK